MKQTRIIVEITVTHDDSLDDVQIGAALEPALHFSTAIEAIDTALFERLGELYGGIGVGIVDSVPESENF